MYNVARYIRLPGKMPISIMSMLQNVSASIDHLLDKQPWTTKEIEFYEMLVNKVARYRRQQQPPKEKGQLQKSKLEECREAIWKNIQEQPLFAKCRHRDILKKYIGGLEIEEIAEMEDPYYRYNLKVKLGDSAAKFVVEFLHKVEPRPTGEKGSLEREHVKYRVSFHGADGVHGYVTYYSPDGKPRHLPEYNKLSEILPELDRVEIVHLATELVSYFDAHGIIAETPIGVRYPISLVELAKQTM